MSLLREQCKVLRLGAVPRVFNEIIHDGTSSTLRNSSPRSCVSESRSQGPQASSFPVYQDATGLLLGRHRPAARNLAGGSGRSALHPPKGSLICMGAVGSGKTHLVTALGIKACVEGMEVRFFRAADLVNQLLELNTKGTLGHFTRELGKCDLLILDELGFVPLHPHGAELLFNVVASCYEQRSVAVTTNLEFGQWNTVLGSNRLTAALVDRLVHHAHVLAFSSQS
jgi:hypothetical protein